MIVAGLGCRRGTPLEALEAAISLACEQAGITRNLISALATGIIKKDEPAIVELAQRLNLHLHIVGDEELKAAEPKTRTVSQHSLAITDSPSLSEAAALAIAGDGAALIAARVVAQGATCALARSEQAP